MAKNVEFKYAPMFQVGEDKTEYRLCKGLQGGPDPLGPAGLPRCGVHAAP